MILYCYKTDSPTQNIVKYCYWNLLDNFFHSGSSES